MAWALPHRHICACMLNRFSHVQLCDPMDQSLPGSSVMGFSRQEYWSGLPCPPPGDLPNPGIEPEYLMSPALASMFFTTSITWKVIAMYSPEQTALLYDSWLSHQ